MPIDVYFLAAMTWATLAITVMTRQVLPLRSCDPHFVDKLVGLTLGNMASMPCWTARPA